MNLTVLGSSSGWAVPHRYPAGFLITTDRQAVLLDAGEGIARQLVRYNADLNRIQAVFVSHTHADHASGLLMFLQRLHLSGKTTPLSIYLPEGVLPGFVQILPYFHIFPEKWSFDIDFIPLSDGSALKEGEITLTPILNGHLRENATYAAPFGIGSDSYSFRVDHKSDPSILYTSDIDTLHHLGSWTKNVQLLLTECSHIPVETCLDFARSFEIPRIVFTHIPPEIDGNGLNSLDLTNSIEIVFAEDGLQFKIESKAYHG